MVFRILFPLLLTMFLLSCTDFKRADRLSQIASMQQELSEIKAQTKADSIDTLAILNDLKQIHLWAFAIDDTIDRELMFQLNSIREITKDLEERNALRRYVLNSVDLKERQLKKLKRDISLDYGERERYDEFLNAEQQYIDSLSDRFTIFQSLNGRLRNESISFISTFKESYEFDSLPAEQFLLD